jgi:hypothetical protein
MDVSSLVARILREDPKCRDDDFLLILRVWIAQLSTLATVEVKKSLRVLLDAYRKKIISSFETIRRSRQKLQEENVSLRGEKYWARQDQAELFKEDLKKKDWRHE